MSFFSTSESTVSCPAWMANAFFANTRLFFISSLTTWTTKSAF